MSFTSKYLLLLFLLILGIVNKFSQKRENQAAIAQLNIQVQDDRRQATPFSFTQFSK